MKGHTAWKEQDQSWQTVGVMLAYTGEDSTGHCGHLEEEKGEGEKEKEKEKERRRRRGEEEEEEEEEEEKKKKNQSVCAEKRTHGLDLEAKIRCYANNEAEGGGQNWNGKQGPRPDVLNQENCRKVTRSVEDAEIKTNVLKQNSALLEEKLRYLQQQLQDETPRRQEAELQELEQKLEAGLTRHGLSSAIPNQGCSCPPGSPEEPSRPRGWGMAVRAGEGPSLAEQDLQKVSTGLEELRVERSAVSVASLRSDLEALGPVKPILEELGRQLQNSRRGANHVLNLDLSAQGPCARCTSQGQQLSTESLQQLLERALTPLVDEVKQKGLAPACPSCQRLHKKILELERQALAKHVRAEALSSTLRLAQDEALRAKNLLLTDKMKPE
ncbi:hypothetical protein STEG23_018906 [Scotinomys teguina]